MRSDPYAAHADALRLRAVSLWCEGLRSPAIARQLNVPERTVRARPADARADFQAEQGETAHEIIALAVERQLALAAAAWQSYHHAVALEQLALDYYHAGLTRAANLKNIDKELPPPPPRPSTAPARYLSVALAAQREAARLSGCYDLVKASASLAVLAAQPQPRPRTYAETRGLDPADERTWDAFLRQLGLSPARFAGPADLDPLYRPAWEALRRKLRSVPSATPATSTASAVTNPAKTATDIPSHGDGGEVARSAGVGVLVSPHPAETATASTGLESAVPATTEAGLGLAAGIQPAEPSTLPIPAETATANIPLAATIATVHAAEPPHTWQHIM